MIPLRDNIPSKKIAFVNIFLILANIFIFGWIFLQAGRGEIYFLKYGLVPKQFLAGRFFDLKTFWEIYLPLATALFLHGGLFHLLGNLLFLWIFGDNVEDRLGHLKYLIFYLAAGVAGNLFQVFLQPESALPIVGASGAVAGVLGAYFIFFPRARILTLVPVFFFLQIIEIPAYIFLGLWFLIQFFYGTAVIGGTQGGIAFWAHIGGFLFGAVFGKFFIK